MTPKAAIAISCLSLLALSSGAAEPRARDLGVPFDGTPGRFNAITDVADVEVGYKTLICGEGRLVVGKGPVRTGVTAIFPRGKAGSNRVSRATSRGTATAHDGTHWIEETGVLETPIIITNTAASAWSATRSWTGWSSAMRRVPFWYPVVTETSEWRAQRHQKGLHVKAEQMRSRRWRTRRADRSPKATSVAGPG